MLKLGLITILSFITFSSTDAQVRGGGGGGGGGGPSESSLPPGMTREEFVMLKVGYNKLISEMNAQWKKCGNDSTIRFQSLSEVYLQLTWRSAAGIANCPEEQRQTIHSCFFDEEMKEELRTLINHKKYRSFIGIFEDPVTEIEIFRYFSMEANRPPEGKDE